MKRICLAVFVLLNLNTLALAKWIVVGDDLTNRHYIDETTIKKNVNGVKAWFLTSKYDSNNLSEGETSSRSLIEFDCKNEKLRTLTRINYGLPLGSGDVVSLDEEPAEWSYVAPDTLGESKFNIACGKEKISELATKTTTKNSWKLLNKSDKQDTYILANRKNTKFIWALFENNEYLNNSLRFDRYNYASQINLINLDCKANRLRYVQYASFSGSMASGNVEDWGYAENTWTEMSDTNFFKIKLCNFKN